MGMDSGSQNGNNANSKSGKNSVNGWTGIHYLFYPGPSYLRPFFLIFIIILILLFYRAAVKTSEKQDISATGRSALTGTVTYSKWYSDESGLISSDAALTEGLEYFYSRTGVQPYVMLLPYEEAFWSNGEWQEEAADTYLANVYNDTFTDGGHLIFAYFGCENDTEEMNGVFHFYYGSSAPAIMNQEAEAIFRDYFAENHSSSDLDVSELIGNTFAQTADQIMYESSEPDPDSDSDNTVLKIGLAAVLIYAVIGLTVVSILRRKSRKKQQNTNEKET